MFTPVCTFLTGTIITYLVWRWYNRPQCVDIRNKHVLITGGSSGIGLALAREAAKRGAYVTIVARNTTRLSKAKEDISQFAEDASKISTLSMDLCGPFKEIKKCLESNIAMFTPVCTFLTGTIITYLVWRWYNRPQCVDIRNKHVLITGGSSGIGLALAREAAKRGAYVTIVARNTTRLSKAKEDISQFAEDASKISTLSMDLCGPFKEIKKCLESNIDVVDILIHCAGFAVAKTFLSTPAEAFDEQMAVSYLGPVHVTKVLLPKMLAPAEDASVQPKDRRIAFFSSIGGQLSIYGYSGYAASKFAVRGFAAVLRQELEPTGILVTTVYPPDTDTPGFAAENKDKPHVTEIISGPAGLWSPDAVATQIMQDILIGRAESVQGIVGWAISLATSGISLPHESMLGPVLAGVLELVLALPLKLLSMLSALWMRWVIVHYAPCHDTSLQTEDE